ncbi:hypothetical protein Q7C36_016826 [Tachysurus vachellii]|uniref:Uncharacterized protein n=1 Tax=Tachysurus vachellii TaxID=175792 RepID=A0AA88M7E4_TACVA|nr:hypothetical protein Q7C36_016826 [Tachysurus vachellii]
MRLVKTCESREQGEISKLKLDCFFCTLETFLHQPYTFFLRHVTFVVPVCLSVCLSVCVCVCLSMCIRLHLTARRQLSVENLLIPESRPCCLRFKNYYTDPIRTWRKKNKTKKPSLSLSLSLSLALFPFSPTPFKLCHVLTVKKKKSLNECLVLRVAPSAFPPTEMKSRATSRYNNLHHC